MDFFALTYYLAPLIGLTTVAIGVGAILRPQHMSGNFGIVASGTANPYVVSVGIRDIFMGFVILNLYFNQLWNELSFVLFCVGMVAISDFLVVHRNGSKKTALVHLLGAIAVTSYGAWLLFITA